MKSKAIYFSVLFVLLVLFVLTFWGVADLKKEARELGDEYLYLAISPDMDNAILYLDKYKEALEKNGFTTGSVGRYYKTVDNDMSFRYQKLITGIDYLKQLNAGDNKDVSYSNFRAAATVSGYVRSLNVGIVNHLTANNLGILFQCWINSLIAGILLLTWFIGGHRICFPYGILWD